MKKVSVYLDHNATTPFSPLWRDEMVHWMELWGNPSSIHYAGRGPKNLMRESRRAIADHIQAEPLELVFTSGGSESNNLALKGVFGSIRRGELLSPDRTELIISSVEHPSVTKTAEYLQNFGVKVIRIGVDRGGHFDLEGFRKALSPRTALVSVMTANNETGNIFPIQQIVSLSHAAGALVHTDAVQTLGKSRVELKSWGVDLASFSGHKFYALKGCGVLYVRKGLVLESLIHGGGQERHRRAGTENLLAIASLGYMCRQQDLLMDRVQHMQSLRDTLESRMLKDIQGVRITGEQAPRLPNTSSVVIENVDGETLLMNLDLMGYSVSTGAACSSGNPEPSPVLLAMGLSRAEAQSSLRLSLGWQTSLQEVEDFLQVLKQIVDRLRGFRHGEGKVYGN